MRKSDGVDASIRLDRVGMVYETTSGPVEALCDITLAVGQGEFVSLVGPSGCGKSTLLRIIAGLRPATSGTVSVNGTGVRKPIPDVGMVFQAPVLLKWRTILDNVLLPAELAGLPAANYRQRAFDLLRLVGLGDFATKRPNELSGGMQQRASICAALWSNRHCPRENSGMPVFVVGLNFRSAPLELLEQLAVEPARRPKALTHLRSADHVQEAVILSDRVVVMSQRPGRITATRDIDLPRPRTIETRASEDLGRLSLEIYRALNRRMA